jgi:serine/threonine protein kinase
VLQKINAGVIDFRYACWKRASEDVKDLLTNMLAKNPTIRYSAEQVLKHRWFEDYRIKQVLNLYLS